MYAITIWQPWASLVIGGWKPYEFRHHELPRFVRGQRVVIHAGARAIKPAEVAELINRLHAGDHCGGVDPACRDWLESVHQSPGRLPLGAGLGTAVLGEPRLSCELWPDDFAHFASDSDRREHSNWAWPVSDIERRCPCARRPGAAWLRHHRSHKAF